MAPPIKTRAPLLCFAALLCLCTTATHAAERPNILFFFADDWGRYASIYSEPETPSLNDVIKTPNIDRIANEGSADTRPVDENSRILPPVCEIVKSPAQ